MPKKSTPNPFDELRALDLFRELDAIPAATGTDNHNHDNVTKLQALSFEKDGNEYVLSCWLFNDGTRSAFSEQTISLAKPEPIVIETEDDLETK